VAAAALAIPDLAALIFSAYCNGIRVDFHPPACVIAAKRSCAAPTRVDRPLTSATNLAGIPIHCATRVKIGAMLPGLSAPPKHRPLHHLRMLEPNRQPLHRRKSKEDQFQPKVIGRGLRKPDGQLQSGIPAFPHFSYS
jgi:hypothetical protein